MLGAMVDRIMPRPWRLRRRAAEAEAETADSHDARDAAPVRVLVIAPQPYYVDRGTPIDVNLLVRALCQRGHAVELVTYHGGEDRHYPGLTLHRIRAPRWLAPAGAGLSLRKLACDVLLLAKAWAVLRRARPDVVHAGEEAVFFAMAFRALHRTPYVYDMDSSIAQQVVEQMPLLRPAAGLLNACERAAVRRCLAAAPVCRALEELAHRHAAAHVQRLDDISLLRVDTPPEPGRVRERAHLRDDDPIVMYVGNFQKYQGLDLLLAAATRALEAGAKFHLVLLGGTDAQIRAYQQRAAEVGAFDRVHCLGPWPLERLHEALADADVLTVPRTKGINTPMKLFPFLHSGKAVLATDLPTHTQVLDERIAMLAAPEPGPFAEALTRLLDDAPLRRRLGEAGRAFVEANHTWDAHCQRVERLYAYVQQQVQG